MENTDIEIKYLIKEIPFDLSIFKYHEIEQAYLCDSPTIRIRKSDNDYYMTYKTKGKDDNLARTEYNLPITKESYLHLLDKADGCVLTKRRYLIPDGKYTIELDVFSGKYKGLILAEVEFDTVKEAKAYKAKDWFYKDVTKRGEYSNSKLALHEELFKDIIEKIQ